MQEAEPQVAKNCSMKQARKHWIELGCFTISTWAQTLPTLTLDATAALIKWAKQRRGFEFSIPCPTLGVRCGDRRRCALARLAFSKRATGRIKTNSHMTKRFKNIDYEFRPESYWDVSDPLPAILVNVKGTRRRPPQLNQLFVESLYEIGWIEKPSGQRRASLPLMTAAERSQENMLFAGWMDAAIKSGEELRKADAVPLYQQRLSMVMSVLKISLYLFEGRGVSKDMKKAAELYGKAADQGNANAQTNLG
jgi:hypothetical protein